MRKTREVLARSSISRTEKSSNSNYKKNARTRSLPTRVLHIRAEVGGKLLRYDLEIAEARSMLLAIDAHYLRETMHHIIGNAIKFTHNGQVRVKLTTKRKQAMLEISDTGIVISESF